MSARERVQKYRHSGGASDLVRVEVLVPASRRDRILEDAAAMRAEHRSRKKHIQDLCSKAAELYGARLLDNIDLARVADPMKQARIVAGALMERGDARAFVMARTILAELER